MGCGDSGSENCVVLRPSDRGSVGVYCAHMGACACVRPVLWTESGACLVLAQGESRGRGGLCLPTLLGGPGSKDMLDLLRSCGASFSSVDLPNSSRAWRNPVSRFFFVFSDIRGPPSSSSSSRVMSSSSIAMCLGLCPFVSAIADVAPLSSAVFPFSWGFPISSVRTTGSR